MQKIRIHWVKDGDHSLKPRKLSGIDEKLLLNHAVVEVADFVSEGFDNNLRIVIWALSIH